MLWDRGHSWTSVALRRRHGAIDFVAGPDLISRWTGPLGGDWRRDQRVVVDAVSRFLAPAHLGIFGEASTVRRLLLRGDPGAWAAAVAMRDVVVNPTPPYVAVAIGADAVRGFASKTARLLGGFDPLSALAPITHLVRTRVAEVSSVTETLGFDPLEVLRNVIRRVPGNEPESDGDAESAP
jgi:hypothetical protein